MQGNGIGPLVSQFVHERNALRKAGETPPKPIKPYPHADRVEFSASALARFEALKAKLARTAEEPGPVAEPDPVATPSEPVDEPDTGASPALTSTLFSSPFRPSLSPDPEPENLSIFV